MTNELKSLEYRLAWLKDDLARKKHQYKLMSESQALEKARLGFDITLLSQKLEELELELATQKARNTPPSSDTPGVHI